MTKIVWDSSSDRKYENGVDQGILFIPTNGVYSNGYPWNGLTTVTESPGGAEAKPQYADNIAYLNLISAETFGGKIEAVTYPDAFAACDGTAVPKPGLKVSQQARSQFGLAYRTKVGSAISADLGYKWHVVYGCQAAPSEKAYATVNDSPEALVFSWDFTTTPVSVTGYKPSAQMTVDSTKVDAAGLTAFETAIMGSANTNPRLPLPDEIIGMFAAAASS